MISQKEDTLYNILCEIEWLYCDPERDKKINTEEHYQEMIDLLWDLIAEEEESD